MDKINLINDYIRRCDEVIEASNQTSAKDLAREIIAVFLAEIPRITSELTSYGLGKYRDDLKDIFTIRAILVNHQANIKREDDIRKYDLEKLQLQRSMLNITNTNDVSSSATANSSATVTITQTLMNTNALPDNILSKEDKEALEEKLAALETLSKSSDKEKTSKKIENILRYVVDKGIEVGIAVLPYLGEISKMLQGK